MTVKSVVGEGTTFTFTLPVVPETGRVKVGHIVPRFLTTSGPTADHEVNVAIPAELIPLLDHLAHAEHPSCGMTAPPFWGVTASSTTL